MSVQMKGKTTTGLRVVTMLGFLLGTLDPVCRGLPRIAGWLSSSEWQYGKVGGTGPGYYICVAFVP